MVDLGRYCDCCAFVRFVFNGMSALGVNEYLWGRYGLSGFEDIFSNVANEICSIWCLLFVGW